MTYRYYPHITILMVAALNLTQAGCSPSGSAPERSSEAADSSDASHPPVPICDAVQSGDINKVRAQLTGATSANSVCSESGGAAMPLLGVAAELGYAEIVLLLIRSGADVNGANGAGFTALSRAAFYGHAAVAKMLLDAGALVDSRTGDGFTALDEAAMSCQTDVVSLLLSAGASANSANNYKRTPLHDAAHSGDSADPAARHAECLQVVSALIQAGAKVNAEDMRGDTPLNNATKSCGSVQIVAQLLGAGANPLMRNREGENAVLHASKCGNTQVYRMVTERARLFLANPEQHP